MLRDSFHRQIDYLRISVTDRCNLRCLYCTPQDQVWKRRQDLLSYEEILSLIRIFIGLGLVRFRITGGEPLLRKGLVGFIQEMNAIPEIEDIALTTNGSLLARYATDLRKAGLRRINISLDSLDPKRYKEITGGGRISEVLTGIEAAIEAGFSPIKLNTVIVRGINDHEIPDLVSFVKDRPLELRFIEFMPIGENGLWSPERFVSGREILERISREFPISKEGNLQIRGGGPAKYYKITGWVGTIGLITSLTGNICQSCNRIRLTADGHLRSCLLADREYDLKHLLRQGFPAGEIRRFIQEAIQKKPLGRCSPTEVGPTKIPMQAIGG